MKRLRTASSRRLTALVAGVAALALTVGIAQGALSGSGALPAPKQLANALLDAFNAPEPEGITARIEFTNNLLPSGSLPGRGASPLASGADGRLWIAKDGRFRLELQSDAGDAQIVSDGKLVTVYDSTSNTVYRATLPEEAEHAAKPGGAGEEEPTLASIQKAIDRLAKTWTISGATPTNTADQPSYTVRISPKDDGGLLGAAEAAWDAVRGAPLRAAVYAQGQSDPVLELKAEEISYGAVSDADVSATPPAGAEVVDLSPQAAEKRDHAGRQGEHEPVTGVDAVQRELDFKLAAPAELAGLPRQEVRLVDFDGDKGALSIYGEGMGAIAVLQRKASTDDDKAAAGRDDDERGQLRLPEINIDGATGTELSTALGTIVTFERDGISYVVAGSVPPVAAENAARGLK